MSGNPHAACPRCGLKREVKNDGIRTKYCMDCKTQRGQATVARGWMDDAACATTDPELFFPTEEDEWRPTRAAKEICASCPVRDMCLADAPSWDRWSIRGGQTATERRRKAVA
jgi:WhiB family redox-sensing transcriptional regulator